MQFVTGGAGFIGSHIVDRLISQDLEVTIIDNLLSGKKTNLNPNATFLKKDIHDNLTKQLKDGDTVFHMAADPDVRSSATNPKPSFDSNVIGTYNLLECCRKADVKHIVFSSTSTVYGDAKTIPTPEDYPCFPISNYGASKLACEAYLSSFAQSYSIKATILRYANIFGERSTHGVIYDFYHKLLKNNKELEILGDGKQDKSYLHISDCVSATLLACKKQKQIFDVFNVGSNEKHTVNDIADIVSKSMHVSPSYRYTGSSRGWIGDVNLMLLDTKKIRNLGWKESVSLDKAVPTYIKWLSSSSL